jgi:hypothetical protein
VQKKDIKGNVNVALVVTPGPDGSQTAAAPVAAAPTAQVVASGAQVAAPAVASPAPAASMPAPAAAAGGAVPPHTGVNGQ